MLVTLIIAVCVVVLLLAFVQVAPIDGKAKQNISIVIVAVVMLWVVLSLVGVVPAPRVERW
jgi:hypothetical protein